MQKTNDLVSGRNLSKKRFMRPLDGYGNHNVVPTVGSLSNVQCCIAQRWSQFIIDHCR